jgi:hypothetical protein
MCTVRHVAPLTTTFLPTDSSLLRRFARAIQSPSIIAAAATASLCSQTVRSPAIQHRDDLAYQAGRGSISRSSVRAANEDASLEPRRQRERCRRSRPRQFRLSHTLQPSLLLARLPNLGAQRRTPIESLDHPSEDRSRPRAAGLHLPIAAAGRVRADAHTAALPETCPWGILARPVQHQGGRRWRGTRLSPRAHRHERCS